MLPQFVCVDIMLWTKLMTLIVDKRIKVNKGKLILIECEKGKNSLALQIGLGLIY